MAGQTNQIVLIAIGMVLIAVMFPLSYSGIAAQVTTTVVSATTYTWPAAVSTVYKILLPILAIVGFVLMFVGSISFAKGKR